MRCHPAAVFVLALGCGAGTEAGSALTQRTVFASVAESDTESAPQHPSVAALPIITVLRGGATTIVVRGDVSRQRARAIARSAARTYRDFNRRFGVTKRDATGRRAVDICVFDSSSRYADAARAVFDREPFFAVGFYMPSHRLVMVDTSRGLGNLRHELIHPLVKDWWPDIPPWLDEGLASLYGTARHRGSRYRFLVNYRLRHLRGAAIRGELPSLSGLAYSTYEDVHGPNERAFYAVGRYLLLYLDRRRNLPRFMRAMRSAKASPEEHLATMKRFINQRRFIRWALRLRR